jgi:uncharacterized protein (AIM24 family)
MVLLVSPCAWATNFFPTLGNGTPTTEKREVKGFTQVELAAAIDLDVQEGDDFSLTITIDSNLQKNITTRVEDDTLVIADEDNFHTRTHPKAVLHLPKLSGVEISGPGDVKVLGRGDHEQVELAIHGSGDLIYSGEAKRLRLSIAGSGDTTLHGAVGRLEVDINGSGDLDARNCVADSGQFRVNGSGSIETTLHNGEAAFFINGSGDIRWAGIAHVVAEEVSGSGSVQHIGER